MGRGWPRRRRAGAGRVSPSVRGVRFLEVRGPRVWERERMGRKRMYRPQVRSRRADIPWQGEGARKRPAGETARKPEALGEGQGRPLPESAPCSWEVPAPDDRFGLRAQNSPEKEEGAGEGPTETSTGAWWPDTSPTPWG